MKIKSLDRGDDGSIRGVVMVANGESIEVSFAIDGEDELAVVHADPYVLGHGYAATADDIHRICAAVHAFSKASGQ